MKFLTYMALIATVSAEEVAKEEKVVPDCTNLDVVNAEAKLKAAKENLDKADDKTKEKLQKAYDMASKYVDREKFQCDNEEYFKDVKTVTEYRDKALVRVKEYKEYDKMTTEEKAEFDAWIKEGGDLKK